MKRASPPESGAWQLLVRFFFTQRASLPPLAADLQLSPAQCHVLHLIEPDRPIPMGQLAETLACDASNVTGLVDRLESRGLVRRRPSDEDRRVKVLVLTPTGCRLRAILRRPHDGPACRSRAPVSPRAARARAHPHASARVAKSWPAPARWQERLASAARFLDGFVTMRATHVRTRRAEFPISDCPALVENWLRTIAMISKTGSSTPSSHVALVRPGAGVAACGHGGRSHVEGVV